jgi:hypothetical protein
MTRTTGPSEHRRPPVLARAIIALYPPRWRRRYGAELEALAQESSAAGARLLVDLARGALDARRHPELAHAGGAPQAGLRQALSTMLMAATTVGLVVCGFVKLSEDVSFHGAPLAADLTRAGALLAAAAGAAVLLGPLFATVRWGIVHRRADVWLRLIVVPAAAGGLWVLATVALSRGAGSIHGGLLAGSAFFSWCFFSCGVTWVAAHGAGRALALTPVELPATLVGHGLWVVVAGALVALSGVVLWGLLATVHAGFGAPGLGGLPLGPVWLALLLAICAAVGVLWHVARSPAPTTAPRVNER